MQSVTPWPKRFVGLSIIAAILLTLYHFLGFCSEQCSHGNKYLIMGISFDIFGLLFFGSLLALFIYSYQNQKIWPIIGLLLASAFGAEIVFIGIQKFMIGTYCPVCLGIATTVIIGSIAFFIQNQYNPKGIRMKNYWNLSALCLGFIFAFFGIVQKDEALAAQNEIKESIAFGNKESNIEVYIFTDWACPACRKIEPKLEKIVNSITPDAKVTFVDHVIHPETMNFIPYNLSFMIHNKPQYFKIRDILTEISLETGKPSEDQIEKAVGKIGVKFDELNYADVAAGIDYFKSLGEKFKVKGTPTLVIVNLSAKKGKKLAGSAEITEDGVKEAIKEMKAL